MHICNPTSQEVQKFKVILGYLTLSGLDNGTLFQTTNNMEVFGAYTLTEPYKFTPLQWDSEPCTEGKRSTAEPEREAQGTAACLTGHRRNQGWMAHEESLDISVHYVLDIR